MLRILILPAGRYRAAEERQLQAREAGGKAGSRAEECQEQEGAGKRRVGAFGPSSC